MPFVYSTNTNWQATYSVSRNGQTNVRTYSEQSCTAPDGVQVESLSYRENGGPPVMVRQLHWGRPVSQQQQIWGFPPAGNVRPSRDHFTSSRIEDVTETEPPVREQQATKEAPAAKKDESGEKKE